MTTPPTDTFVPLTAAPKTSGNRPDFRLLVASQAEGARPFRPQSPPAAMMPEPVLAKAGCEPQVALHREGDRITGIHIHCSCGQTIDLTCVYQPQAQ